MYLITLKFVTSCVRVLLFDCNLINSPVTNSHYGVFIKCILYMFINLIFVILCPASSYQCLYITNISQTTDSFCGDI